MKNKRGPHKIEESLKQTEKKKVHPIKGSQSKSLKYCLPALLWSSEPVPSLLPKQPLAPCYSDVFPLRVEALNILLDICVHIP